MWYEETDIIFGLRASISIKITYSLCYRKIMLASVIWHSGLHFSLVFVLYLQFVQCGDHNRAETLPFRVICSVNKCQILKDGMRQVRINRTSTGALYRLYRFSGLIANLQNKTNLVQNLFFIYLSISTCFGQLCAHHQEKQLCFCDTWYLLFCVNDIYRV